MTEKTVDTVDGASEETNAPAHPVPVPQAAWEALERLQLAAQVSQQQLQVFVDGLALGQGIAQGAQLTQLPQGGWAWVPGEQARRE